MPEPGPFYVSIDTGGTFTDGYVSHPDGSTTVKVPTTKHDLTVSFLDCIDELAGAFDLGTEEFLLSTEVVRFSTTIGTNTIIERAGPKVGLIVTEGQEDSLARMEADGDGIEAFTDENLIVGIPERTDQDGEVVDPVDSAEVVTAAKQLMNRGAKLVVISLVNSFFDTTNEESARRIIESEYPPHYLGPNRVLTANEVSSRPGYRARTYTALINAYIHRPMARSLYKAEDEVRDQGYRHPLLIGQATGGAAGVSKTVALNTYNSGPAVGILGAREFCELYDLENAVSTDMGGTSIDIGTIVDGTVSRDLTPAIDGLPVHIPMVEVHTAGAGGGSIAAIDGGSVTVGPESAGAEPGPACYDLGGFEPTVTDADVALGYIDPDYFLGGEQSLNPDRAAEAIERVVAEPLDVSVPEAAAKIRETVDRNIGASLITQLDRHNIDPGETTLIAFGGAGPTHCCSFAAEAGVDQIITSPSAAAFSAFGGATLDVEHRYTRAVGAPISTDGIDIQVGHYNATVEELREEAVQDMEGEGFDADEVSLSLRAIVEGVDGIVEVPAPLEIDQTDELTEVAEKVSADPEASMTLDTLVLLATGPVPSAEFEPMPLGGDDPSDARKDSREVYWSSSGWTETQVFQREQLEPGNVVEGRAIVEATDTTYVITDGWEYRVDEYGNGIIG